MSTIPAQALPALLGRLEAALVERELARPEDFQPGLDLKTIRESTGALPLALLDEVVALYEWHDGMSGSELLPGLRFNSLDTAVAQCKSEIKELSEGLDSWELDWFPVFESEGCTQFVRCGAVERGGLWYTCPEFNDLGWLADTVQDWVEWCVRVYEEDLETGPPDVESLVKALIGDDQLRKQKARGRLVAYQYPEAIEPLLQLLGKQDHEVVVDAAKILGSSGRPETITPMIMVAARWERRGTLDNPVLHELYRYGQDSVTLLTDALSADGEGLRAAAATCIGALGDARAYPALHAALSDPSELVRSAVTKAIAHLQR